MSSMTEILLFRRWRKKCFGAKFFSLGLILISKRIKKTTPYRRFFLNVSCLLSSAFFFFIIAKHCLVIYKNPFLYIFMIKWHEQAIIQCKDTINTLESEYKSTLLQIHFPKAEWVNYLIIIDQQSIAFQRELACVSMMPLNS